MSGRLLRLLLWVGGAFLCAPFLISIAALVPAYVYISRSTNIILTTQLFTSLLWYSGFIIGIPAAIISLSARTKAGRLLAVSATIFGIALITMGNTQRHMFTNNGVAGGMGMFILHSLFPITLWFISIVLAKKAVSQDQMEMDQTQCNCSEADTEGK